MASLPPGTAESLPSFIGNATGAIVVTRHGCANDMRTLADVEAFVDSHGGW